MLELELDTSGLERSPSADFDQWMEEAVTYGCQSDLWAIARQLLPHAAPATVDRVAEAISLRGAALINALLNRFFETDAALAVLEDHAGAFKCLRQFEDEVRAQRGLECLAAAPVSADAMIAKGEIFTLALGTDLHVFWTV